MSNGAEAELPRIEDNALPYETFAVGFTPTKTGNWVAAMLVKIEPAQSV